ncbi:MAG: hypothetical protein LBC56_08470 [Oscillospiraceae bacterium]|jgi:hypothetical protein|nr:hypothetical protein [Oscillospiraceae bacterium]
MTEVFSHVEQTRYALSHLFEAGLMTARAEGEISACRKNAAELGLSRAAGLLESLLQRLAAYKSGEENISGAVLRLSNCVSYYDVLLKMLIIKSICKAAQGREGA